MDGATAGLVGGIAGGAIGLIGGALGMYASVKNTNGPRERRFVVRCGVLITAAVAGMLTFMFFGPLYLRFLGWVPMTFILAWGIPRWNRRQMEIRAEEAGGLARE